MHVSIVTESFARIISIWLSTIVISTVAFVYIYGSVVKLVDASRFHKGMTVHFQDYFSLGVMVMTMQIVAVVLCIAGDYIFVCLTKTTKAKM